MLSQCPVAMSVCPAVAASLKHCLGSCESTSTGTALWHIACKSARHDKALHVLVHAAYMQKELHAEEQQAGHTAFALLIAGGCLQA